MLKYLAGILSVFLITATFGTAKAKELVIYSGRSKSLVEPIIRQFEKETGVKVKVRYGDTAQLAVALLEEGSKSPADLFWAQDAGGLGAVSKQGLFDKLPESIRSKVPESFRNSVGTWVATSGRARVLAYSPKRVKPEALPKSIFDLTDPKWKGRIGWAPQNASFQAFVTAMRLLVGEEKTEEWLRRVKANGAKSYPKNAPIIRALADGEIDLGLPNHYYLLRFKKSDSKFPVEQTFFTAGDPGNLVNVAGIGTLKSSRHAEEGLTFVNFLLSGKAQQFFVSETFEYPVTDEVISNTKLVPLDELLKLTPKLNLEKLDDLDGTLKLLRKVGLL
ncbi:MAG: iron ABC transporter substrate-binding protein [Candidatus Poribacteria bacterium]|nr:iron ABC transporter substrate-binding protein [Candidatus Poribacteria bacterium]